MRILQISSAENFGGGEKHFADLCRGLTEKNHDVSIAVRPNSIWLESLAFLPPENIIRLPLRNSLDIFGARKLAGIIREKKIEIVHAHLARDYAIAAIAAKRTKTKLVLTRHLLFPLNAAYKFLLPKNTEFIAVSEGVRQKILSQKILPPEQIHLIYNGIDTRHFQTAGKVDKVSLRKNLNLPPNCKIVGIVGEISAHKGQEDFVKAASIVLKNFPKTEFLIVGRDSSPKREFLKSLEELIVKLDLQNKIHLLGFWKDTAPLYSSLDVFVSASRVEPFGLVIAEAMASASAVVATATDGAREIISDGETGKLVPIKNPQRIAEAVSAFLSDEQMRSDYSRKARIRIEEKFSLEKMISETEKLYKNLLAKSPKKS